jgi:LmbE family N-acetylglucosaminyl deacetylase
MPINALFLFAHQDDEFGVFQAIEDCLRQGMRVRCAYLTHGAAGSAVRRNTESLAVLAELGVAREDIAFAGDELGICDAFLSRHMAAAGAWLSHWLAGAAATGEVALLCLPAWEGGHHDHDALHALGLHTSERLGLAASVRQYALYHAFRCPGPFFRVLSPLAANGAPQAARIGWGARWRYLRHCVTGYPSQRVTWIGLAPFVALHYLFDGRQLLQPARLARLAERPHAGPLYYERRKFYTYERLRHDIQQWLQTSPVTE